MPEATRGYPIAVGWPGYRDVLVREIHAGLVATGIDARIETRGADAFELLMLRVRGPVGGVEACENWILRQVHPFDEQDVEWASDLACILYQRWREFLIWTGDADQWAEVAPQLVQLDRQLESLPRAFATPAYWLGFPNPVRVGGVARSTVALARVLPMVSWNACGAVSERPEWIALGVAERSRAHELVDVAHGLASRGIAACYCEVRSSRPERVLVFVDARDDDLQQLICRIEDATADCADAWADSARTWARAWIPSTPVLRCSKREWREMAQRLERALPGVCVDACFQHSGSGEIHVPLCDVDRVLDVIEQP